MTAKTIAATEGRLRVPTKDDRRERRRKVILLLVALMIVMVFLLSMLASITPQ